MIRRALTAATVVVIALALSACGSSSTSTNSSSAESAEPRAAFAGKGENGELAMAGSESTPEEREAASSVVEESLKARAAGDFAGQCETLASELIKGLEARGSKGILKKNCTTTLEGMARRATPGSLNNPMTEPLAALVVNGNLAFAFFHGAGGKDFVVPMEKEGSAWKVSSLEVQETP